MQMRSQSRIFFSWDYIAADTIFSPDTPIGLMRIS